MSIFNAPLVSQNLCICDKLLFLQRVQQLFITNSNSAINSNVDSTLSTLWFEVISLFKQVLKFFCNCIFIICPFYRKLMFSTKKLNSDSVTPDVFLAAFFAPVVPFFTHTPYPTIRNISASFWYQD